MGHPRLTLTLTLTLTLIGCRFLLGWVIRGTKTKGLLEAAAQKYDLEFEVLQIEPYLDQV